MKILHDFVMEIEARAMTHAVARLYEQGQIDWMPKAIDTALAELRRLAPRATDGGYELHVEHVTADPGEGAYWDVSCSSEGDEQRYGLDLSPWKDWLAMHVPPALEDAMQAAEIVAHCVWEMTFCGFTPEAVAETRAELERRVREINGGKVKMIPWEEMKAELREKFPDLRRREELPNQ
jgi:hypothetical protein